MRDLLLDRPLRDLDFAVEGDAIRLAQTVAKEFDCPIESHRRFGTATLRLKDIEVDFATARREEYRESGALPTVEDGTILDDLGRRDFTINAVAIPIWPDESFAPIDPYSGLSDLDDGRLEVIHNDSFVDDPTRIIRGVRLETRLGMELSEKSRHLIREAIRSDIFDRISGVRIQHELALSLDNNQPSGRILERLAELGLLQVLLPTLELSPGALGRLEKVQDTDWGDFPFDDIANPAGRWLANLMAICSELSETARGTVASRLALTGWTKDLLTRGVSDIQRLETRLRSAELLPHEVVRDLSSLRSEQLALLSTSETSMVRNWVDRWVRDLRHIELTIRGEDLVSRGHSPGPPIGKALTITRNALLDGAIQPEEELEYALRILEADQVQ